VEYEGALYHVMDRCNRLEAIFCDDQDRGVFLKTLGEASERCGWRVHCYVLMDNHYHLLLETTEANLSRGMRLLQGIYARKRGPEWHEVWPSLGGPTLTPEPAPTRRSCRG